MSSTLIIYLLYCIAVTIISIEPEGTLALEHEINSYLLYPLPNITLVMKQRISQAKVKVNSTLWWTRISECSTRIRAFCDKCYSIWNAMATLILVGISAPYMRWYELIISIDLLDWNRQLCKYCISSNFLPSTYSRQNWKITCKLFATQYISLSGVSLSRRIFFFFRISELI